MKENVHVRVFSEEEIKSFSRAKKKEFLIQILRDINIALAFYPLKIAFSKVRVSIVWDPVQLPNGQPFIAGVDTTGTMYISADEFLKMPQHERFFTVAHELKHLLTMDPVRGERMQREAIHVYGWPDTPEARAQLHMIINALQDSSDNEFLALLGIEVPESDWRFQHVKQAFGVKPTFVTEKMFKQIMSKWQEFKGSLEKLIEKMESPDVIPVPIQSNNQQGQLGHASNSHTGQSQQGGYQGTGSLQKKDRTGTKSENQMKQAGWKDDGKQNPSSMGPLDKWLGAKGAKNNKNSSGRSGKGLNNNTINAGASGTAGSRLPEGTEKLGTAGEQSNENATEAAQGARAGVNGKIGEGSEGPNGLQEVQQDKRRGKHESSVSGSRNPFKGTEYGRFIEELRKSMKEILKEGNPEMYNDTDPEVVVRKWNKVLAQAIMQHQAMRGTGAGNMLSELQEYFRSPIDWRIILKTVILGAMGRTKITKTYSHPPRKVDGAAGRKRIGPRRVWVLWDTSASISDEMLKTTRGDIYEIAERTRSELVVIPWDDAVYEPVVIKRRSDWDKIKQIPGRGGTTILKPLKYMKNQLQKKRVKYGDIIVIFSDFEVEPITDEHRAIVSALVKRTKTPLILVDTTVWEVRLNKLFSKQ